jgi:hypothetical protein
MTEFCGNFILMVLEVRIWGSDLRKGMSRQERASRMLETESWQ